MVWGWLTSIAILLVGFWLWFHRDPMRYITPTSAYLSPADGVVSSVQTLHGTTTRVKKKQGGIDVFTHDFPDAAHLIVITLQIHHIHTQRAPIPGIITDVTYKAGSHHNAVYGDANYATASNEHLGFTIEDQKRKCKVYLVAGMVARRVKALVHRDEEVQQGQRIGRIRLGSQVVLVLPPCDIKVGKGDRVYAGLTEVAR